MKIRSKTLFDFLEQEGALGKSVEEVAQAKILYRKQYMSDYHKRRRRELKSIRFYLTKRQITKLKATAEKEGLPPTTLVKSLTLERLNQTETVSSKELQPVAKDLGLAINRLTQTKIDKDILKLLVQTEQTLLSMLNL